VSIEKLRITLVTILTAALLAACGSVAVRKQPQQIMIASDVYLLLPRASELTESFNATQAIVAEYEDRSYSFEAHIEVRPGSITIVGLNALGGALFSISFDGMELRASGAVEAQVNNAEYVLADVLLAHWDPAWLSDRLDGASIEVSQSSSDRFISRQDELIIGISYESADPWGGKATLTHLERGYVLNIRTVEYTTS